MIDTIAQSYLDEHIPYRMSLIDSFCMTMIQRFGPILGSERPAGFASNEVRFESYSGSRFVPLTEFTNLTIEAGLISCRVMMQFFDITANPTDEIAVKTYGKSQNDDFTFKRIELDRMNLFRLTADRINQVTLGSCQIFPGMFSLSRALNELLNNANKASGHLTVGDKPEYGIEKYLTALSVLVFLEDLVYLQFGREVPYYAQWTRRLLEPELSAIHQDIKRQLQECLRRNMYPDLGL